MGPEEQASNKTFEHSLPMYSQCITFSKHLMPALETMMKLRTQIPNYKEVPKVVSFLLLQSNNYLSCVLFIK